MENYDVNRFTTTSFFKLFAFGTYFVNLLKNGLQRFSKPCYRQFAKRIGRLIKHTLQNISDHFDTFRKTHQNHPEERALTDRIEVEYNNFFLRAVKSIFRSSANAGMWQYLASVPYDTIKEDIIWHAYALYHFSDEVHLIQLRAERDFCVKVRNELLQSATSFEDTLSGLPDTEVMFLLTTFASKIAFTNVCFTSFSCIIFHFRYGHCEKL